ncbi:LuxR family transcriptional regulator [Pararobbsia silviterrae]|uniref:LuxR family transcriptional regulator n=1 Tax=Pararobbsia silviterrae TaxID=1792498 RepID=UPI001F0BCBF7|nr:PAS domain S-box protein [Pararobbsia silviterrae]
MDWGVEIVKPIESENIGKAFAFGGEDFAFEFIDTLPDMVFLVDESGVIRFANTACSEILGYGQSELIEQRIMDLVIAGDRGRTEREAAAVLSGRPRFGFQNRYGHKNGTDVHLSWSARWMATRRLRVGVARDVSGLRSPMLTVGELVVSNALIEGLAPYERRVLQLLLTEASEKEIAEQLGLAKSTTHFYVTGIFRKLKVRSRAGLMSLCMRSLVGLADPGT